MSNWFFNDEQPDDTPVEEPERPYDVTGALECQDCGRYIHGGYIGRSTGDLVWYCPCGHVSKIEEFE